MPGNFFDTNVLMYIASGEPAKADRAESLIRDGGTISVQILNEITHVARRKMLMSWEEANRLLSLVRGLLTVEPITIETHETGLVLAERYRFGIYDAMVVASALLANCDKLWSEDMQDHLLIDGRLRIANPFRVAS
jgi:predicted nucleic acid-binding protein